MDGLCSSGLERHNHAAHSNLQYPQRMDGLCSQTLSPYFPYNFLLQYPQRMDGLCSSTACNCLMVSSPLAVSSADGRALQLILLERPFVMDRHLQYPQRMDGLCSHDIYPSSHVCPYLAVSSADGRALQRYWACSRAQIDVPCSILSGWTGFAAYAPMTSG